MQMSTYKVILPGNLSKVGNFVAAKWKGRESRVEENWYSENFITACYHYIGVMKMY